MLEALLAGVTEPAPDHAVSDFQLPSEFTLSELQALCEALLGRALDRRNFRRKVQEAGFLAKVKGQREGKHRPAQLFKFLPKEFARYVAQERALPW